MYPPNESHSASMAELEHARWWAVRRAQNRKPASYRCPLCGRSLHAMSGHMLIAPEGDSEQRRHAHTDCVAAARQAGRLLQWTNGVGLSRARLICWGACSGDEVHES
jgi:hypothetical protein